MVAVAASIAINIAITIAITIATTRATIVAAIFAVYAAWKATRVATGDAAIVIRCVADVAAGGAAIVTIYRRQTAGAVPMKIFSVTGGLHNEPVVGTARHLPGGHSAEAGKQGRTAGGHRRLALSAIGWELASVAGPGPALL